MHHLKNDNKLSVYVPSVLDWDWLKTDDIVADLTKQHERFGFDRFMLAFPNKGFRSTAMPTVAYAKEHAARFKEIKERLAPLGISLGWWFDATIKVGHTDGYIYMVRENGTEAPFSPCPLDPSYRAYLSEFIIAFLTIGHPDFMFMEDDLSIHASTGAHGCFCQRHLEAFAKKQGKHFTREELSAIFAQKTPATLDLLRAWQETLKESLVIFAEDIRRAVDAVDPAIPIGAMQPSAADEDGNSTYAVAKALAGTRHTPLSRLYGAMYNGVRVQDIPTQLFHPIYSKQHIKADFVPIFESDCYPHTRFFTSGKEMQAMIAAAYAAGFVGSTLQTAQNLDDPSEDDGFAAAFAKERPRHEALREAVSGCTLRGVEITYDPFYNTLEKKTDKLPLFTQAVSLMGIPYTTEEAPVAFFDRRPAMYFPEERVLHYLKKTLILDGAAARALCDRGYGKYLGVSVGEDAGVPPFSYDACAREVLAPHIATESVGRHMAIPHLYSAGHSGKLLPLTPTSDKTEVLTEAVTFEKKPVGVAMTRYKNSLGGTVIVMGMTLENNYSQSLFNYRRQKLLQQVIREANDTLVLVKDAPRIFTLMNEPLANSKNNAIGYLTLINLSSDDREELTLHLPPHWQHYRTLFSMNETGEWQPIPAQRIGSDLRLRLPLPYLAPVHLMFQ